MNVNRPIYWKFLPYIIVLVVILIYSLTPSGWVTFRSFVLLAEFSPRQNFKILDSLGGKYTIGGENIEASGGAIPATIYRPVSDKKSPAVIFLIGTRGLRDSPGVIRFADLFARAGFVVLIPEVDDLVQIKMRDTTIGRIDTIFDYLATRDYVDPKKVGLSGICAGGALSLIAASDLHISDRVKFVQVVSPYFDVWELSRELFTGKVHDNGKVDDWKPQNDAKAQLQLWYIGQVESELEQALLKDIFINNKTVVDGDLENLSDKARNIYNFIRSTNDEDFDPSRELLPTDVKVQVEAMSPKGKVSNLKARVYILADSFDPTVASVESKRLVESLPKNQVEFSYLSSLAHVVPLKNADRLNLVHDGIKLFFHIRSFLAYMDKS